MLTYRLGTSQNVTVSGTSAQSAALGASIQTVRVVATTDCYIKTGANPTADTTTSLLLKANTPEYFLVAPGVKIAAIQSTAGGTLNITEMTR